MKRALLSVYDKTGLVAFAQALSSQGVELIASGGTAGALRDAGLSVTTVEELTGLPGILGGRVKTLHPAIHGGILAQDNADDRATLAARGWQPIDLVVVNLYPFTQTIAKPGVTLAEAIEQIDIGGVALLRAAAKNYARVTVVAGPEDYETVLAELREAGDTTPETRQVLALKVFQVTAAYDRAIAGYLAGEGASEDALPAMLDLSLPQAQTLRYGENPHQAAALYAAPGVGPLGGELLQGKPLSYNNLLDLDAAWKAADDFAEQTVVIVKHLSPCGVASGGDLAETFRAALASDPVSAFGGVIACNRPFGESIADALGDLFVEAIAAPAFTDGAREVLASRPNCRLLQIDPAPDPGYGLRSVRGGVLAQTHDRGDAPEWKVVTKRAPSDAEMESLRFAWKVVKHVKSNAIVLAQGRASIGIGGGLPSRVDAVKHAAYKAGERASGTVLASDAFFPFPDGPEAAAGVGVTAIVQPGGSVRDEAVIEAADRLGLAMCFTGMRHFRH
jgi:phosphoribosylaminoimidazolecarboxamide formyltransferase/IMP cyclohydrolase